MPTDADVRELLDRAWIADTINAYSEYADNADVGSIVGLFTADGVYDLGGGVVHRGELELREMFVDRFTLYSATSFHSSGIRILRYDGDTASVTSNFYGIHDAPEMDRRMHLWGRFADEMVRRDRTWLFTRRQLLVAGIGHTGSQEVPARFTRTARIRLESPESPDGPAS